MKSFSGIFFPIMIFSIVIGPGSRKPGTSMVIPGTLPAVSGKEKIILLDRYFNSEKRKDSTGNFVYWHYTWNEKGYPGFSVFGNLFKVSGATLSSLDTAPDVDHLRKASVYIIVDPDHVKDNPTPNYITDKDTKAISQWVKEGGVLLLMANDSANCDLEHFNILAASFGIIFTNASGNLVQNDEFESGMVIANNKQVFKHGYKMFLKDISLLNIKDPAKALVTKNGAVVMAISKYGKGTVFAVGDPWLYNEYIDTRRLPAGYKNFSAAEDLVKWLLKISMMPGNQ